MKGLINTLIRISRNNNLIKTNRLISIYTYKRSFILSNCCSSFHLTIDGPAIVYGFCFSFRGGFISCINLINGAVDWHFLL